MNFTAHNLYHVYNRTNASRSLFLDDKDYLRFLEKTTMLIKPYCEILAWSLIPNHFHFLIYATEKSIEQKKVGGNELQLLTNGFKICLSSHSNSINKKAETSGNLFQQKTKAKLVEGKDYPLIVFHYLHQNAYKARMVTKLEDWPYSSFNDFAGLRNGKLCNKELAIQLLNLDMNRLYEESYKMIDEHLMRW